MNVEDMRSAISDVYPSGSWTRKCDRMSDEQVTAVYLKFKAQGKFDVQLARGNQKGLRSIAGVIDIYCGDACNADVADIKRSTNVASVASRRKKPAQYSTFDEALLGDDEYV